MATPAAPVAPKTEVPDHFTGKKICHRMYIPFDVQTPQQDPIDPKRVKINVNAQIANIPCAGVKCALWDERRSQCLDVTAAQAQIKLAETLEAMDGHARMHTQEG